MNAPRVCCIEGCDKPFRARGLCVNHYKTARRSGKIDRAHAKHGEGAAFVEAALISETNECIIWPFGKNRGGYPTITIDGASVSGHRYVCERHNGPAPDGLLACHSCGNRACMNKHHLRWGTYKENAEDMIEHGTRRRGDEVSGKLTADDVSEIRSLHPSLNMSELARRYGVHHSCIQKIIHRQTWTHI